MKRYLLFISHSYSYTMLRPIEDEVRRRGDDCAWFIEEETCPDLLRPDEKRLLTVEQVIDYNPIACIAPGNWVYDFFPGVKVHTFHGYPVQKRFEKVDDHFEVREWFDIYCTAGPSCTPTFKELENKHGYFRVYETGGPKIDHFFSPGLSAEPERQRPCILYAPTFTRSVTSAPSMLSAIDRMAGECPWDWHILLHPKLPPQIFDAYRDLASRHDNVQFLEVNEGVETYRKTDAMLADSSSIILEYMLLDKPVVTFNNSHPGPHLINVTDPDLVADAIARALTRPADLMDEVHKYGLWHEAHRDGRNSARVLDAIDDFIANYQGKIRRKPLNLIRKIKLRWRLRKRYSFTFLFTSLFFHS
ncbi:MAG: CDP-glycerol glycerophosphotransferase family protein [Bacteroidales bacterium]|nr:CDP-glycerol glycerophosphotransferase family protein [Candidatus Liminaster caballi]